MFQKLPIIRKRCSTRFPTEIHNTSNPLFEDESKRNLFLKPKMKDTKKKFFSNTTISFSKDLFKRNDMKKKTYVLKSKIDLNCDTIDYDCKKLFKQMLSEHNVEEEEEENSLDNFKTDVKILNEEIDKKGFFKIYRTKYNPTQLKKDFISSKPDNIFYKNKIIDSMPSEYVYKFRKVINKNFKMNLPFYSKSQKKTRKIDNQRFNILKKFNQDIVYQKNLADKYNIKVNKSAVEYWKI